MAAKRSATSELNHDNWNEEEEREDSGTFQRASEDSLKRRIIKTARRRNPISSVRSGDTDVKSAFTGFTAFTKAAVPPTASTFSFLSNITSQAEKPETNGTSVEEAEKKSTSSPSSSNKSIFPDAKESATKSNDYFSKLKGLNESVASWIKRHVDANPLINLQPIFRDYEQYFKELEKEGPKAITNDVDKKKKDDNTSSFSTFVFKPAVNVSDSATEKSQLESYKAGTNNIPQFSFGLPTSTKSTFEEKLSIGFSSTGTSHTFSFGSSNMSTSTASAPSFSFGNPIASSSTDLSASGSGQKPFAFSNVAQPDNAKESKKEDDAEEDSGPPKVEFTPVVEKDYIFTTRCKVFVKKPDGNYGDRGVGNLYLKPIESSGKVQLIVRADTNLGNLLCNFILAECIPTKRIGKKDVMLVCLPTPDVKPPPVPVLLRVKSPEEADNLLEVLEKHKK